jgi:hypothetical protein
LPLNSWRWRQRSHYSKRCLRLIRDGLAPLAFAWFRTFAMNVSQIYDGDGEPVEMKIELEKGELAK